MGANMLDTYTLVKRLTQAGVPEAQAEAHMAVFLDMSERGFATKGDIGELKGDIAELGKRIDDLTTHVSGMEMRLMIRLGGLIVTLMSVGFGILEFTHAH